MRLNLGCGKHYKNGFINIDAYDNTVADAIMPVEDLAFPSNTINAIEAHQLIEHLGYLHTIYALAEWFRVLKPGGSLLIETPDIQSTIQQYLDGDHDIKKETLTWLYGSGSLGMQHRLCFPEVLIKTLLKNAGFTKITTSFFIKEKNRPVMRIYCKKQQNATPFQIIAQGRKILVKQHRIAFEESTLALEQEKLLDVFLQKLQQYQKQHNEKILEKLIVDGCIQSTSITQVLLQECFRQMNVSNQTKRKYSGCVRFLSSLHFSGLLVSFLRETDSGAGTQKKTIQIVTEFGIQCIQKLLSHSKETDRVKKVLAELSQRSSYNKNWFFSESYLEYLAADQCYKAIKYFLKKDFTHASDALQEAIRFDKNHLLYYWNLARIFMLRKKYYEARQCYQDVLTLICLSDAPSKKELEMAVSRELRHFSIQKHGWPILDVRQ